MGKRTRARCDYYSDADRRLFDLVHPKSTLFERSFAIVIAVVEVPWTQTHTQKGNADAYKEGNVRDDFLLVRTRTGAAFHTH